MADKKDAKSQGPSFGYPRPAPKPSATKKKRGRPGKEESTD